MAAMETPTKTKTRICEHCRGTGVVLVRRFSRRPKYSEATRRRAIRLWDKGLSLRLIAARLRLNSPQTVKNLLLRSHSEVANGR